MKKLKYLLYSLGLLSFLSGCEIISSEVISGTLLSHSECKSGKKSADVADSISCVNYSYDAAQKVLQLTHVNAGFNCCPEKISCRFSVKGDTITITEQERSALCSCDCLFDLEMELSGVEAKCYRIVISEPYAEGMEPLDFEVDLASVPEGSFCVNRKSYPWGMSAYE